LLLVLSLGNGGDRVMKDVMKGSLEGKEFSHAKGLLAGYDFDY
jgi:hypothetical protein